MEDVNANRPASARKKAIELLDQARTAISRDCYYLTQDDQDSIMIRLRDVVEHIERVYDERRPNGNGK